MTLSLALLVTTAAVVGRADATIEHAVAHVPPLPHPARKEREETQYGIIPEEGYALRLRDKKRKHPTNGKIQEYYADLRQRNTYRTPRDSNFQ